jgi:hypothetical protein
LIKTKVYRFKFYGIYVLNFERRALGIALSALSTQKGRSPRRGSGLFAHTGGRAVGDYCR